MGERKYRVKNIMHGIAVELVQKAFKGKYALARVVKAAGGVYAPGSLLLIRTGKDLGDDVDLYGQRLLFISYGAVLVELEECDAVIDPEEAAVMAELEECDE